jgi:hypothetical protein
VGVAQVSLRDCHRAALRRRSILCGTFRDAVVAATLRRRSNLAPWRYQARCPCHEFWLALARPPCLTTVSGLSSRPRSSPASQEAGNTTGTSDHPAHPPLSLYLGNRLGGASELVEFSDDIEAAFPFGAFAITKHLLSMWCADTVEPRPL